MKTGTLLLGLALALVIGTGAHAEDQKPLKPLAATFAAPDFSLPDMDGKLHRLSDYRGKVVIVNFWATWCPPCIREMPSMQRARLDLEKDGIVILAVNVGETTDTVFQFSGDYPMDFTVLFDRDSSVTDQWPILALPTTFVVAPDGQVHFRAVGGREWDDPVLIAPLRALRDPRRN